MTLVWERDDGKTGLMSWNVYSAHVVYYHGYVGYRDENDEWIGLPDHVYLTRCIYTGGLLKTMFRFIISAAWWLVLVSVAAWFVPGRVWEAIMRQWFRFVWYLYSLGICGIWSC
jgi:hypothetical protein